MFEYKVNENLNVIFSKLGHVDTENKKTEATNCWGIAPPLLL